MKKHRSSYFIISSFTFAILFCDCEKQFTDKNYFDENTAGNIETAGKPNIIFIVGDDIGYEIPTVDGGRSYTTPNLNKLANEGMRFMQVRSAPLCSPSRFMLLTGKYNFRNYTIWGKMDTTQHTIGNMLKDAGYVTCYAGKWQLDGGDNSIRKFGFDKYSVWLPYKICPERDAGSRYKDPVIYQGGKYLPASATSGKYSEDIFTDYVINFMDNNRSRPFFIYYAMILGHFPYCPTTDDPEFATWDPDPLHSDAAFYPSMIKYMDKKIGMILNKMEKLGLTNNTIIIYVGDNGTPKEITSLYKKTTIRGSKGNTNEYGIHVPLFCNWHGVISPGTLNRNLIDFTDFLPTLADVAKIQVPSGYGILDGISFYPQLTGSTSKVRKSIFTDFEPNLCESNSKARYAQDSVYKLYDGGSFYNFRKDVFEKSPLVNAALTVNQKRIKRDMQGVIDQMHN